MTVDRVCGMGRFGVEEKKAKDFKILYYGKPITLRELQGMAEEDSLAYMIETQNRDGTNQTRVPATVILKDLVSAIDNGQYNGRIIMLEKRYRSKVKVGGEVKDGT